MARKALRFHAFGCENLTLETLPEHPISENEVRVKPLAVSLNYRDFLMVSGFYDPKLKLPLIPCSDGAGEVLEVGAQVTDLAPGDRVCSTMIPDWEKGEPGHDILRTTVGGPLDGLLATDVVLPRQTWLKVPDTIDNHTAACLPVAGLTAWTALAQFGQIGPGSKVLLLGTGGVSTMALQIAKALGATVAITSGSAEKLERALAMGADHGINYRTHPKWSEEVLAWAPQGVDLVVEVGGAGTFNQSVKSVRIGGKIALIGVLAQAQDPIQLVPVLMKNICVQGILVGHRQAFHEYLAFVSQHNLKPVVDRVFTGLEQAPQAFATMAQGKHFGKLVIDLSA